MKFTLVVVLGLAAALGGCSKAEKSSPALAPAMMEMAPMASSAPPPQDDEDATAEVVVPPPPIPTTAVAPARLLIYHADLRLKVDNLGRASSSLDSLVRRHHGYLSAATETRADGEWRQAMTIRVQPAQFQLLLAALGGLGTVEEKKLTTDDVTAQHADIAARLSTKRAVEKRYIALLERSKKISEILEVESKIGEVREEIESTESRLKALNDEVTYSTIFVTCYQPLAQPVPDAPVVSLGSRVVEAFYGGWQLLTSLFVGTIAIWPLLLLGAAGIWFWRHRMARLKKRAVAASHA